MTRLKKQRIYQDGSRSRAFCYECEKVVLISMEFKPIESGEDDNFMMLNLLVGICEICNTIVNTPQQSAEEIKLCRRVFRTLKKVI